MAKKNEIIEKLSALKPNVPTSSRVGPKAIKSTGKEKKPANPAVIMSSSSEVMSAGEAEKASIEQPTVQQTKEKPKISNLMRDNVSEVLQWGGMLVKESEQVFLTLIDGWQKSVTLYTTLVLKNINYLLGFVKSKEDKK
ncbi:MAG TPA: hypothetical protein VJL89_09300 [Thermodesulfovibrionia bacterium]|nr:hypothetical protein [Thermodesulfovibrionia bacterium]